MRCKQRAIAVRSFCDAGLLRGLTRRARLVLSARYHGVVFACVEEVPAVAYAVNPVLHRKVVGVIDMLNVSHVIVYNPAKDSTDGLLPALERAMQLLAPAGNSSDSGASVCLNAARSNERFVRRALGKICP
jgi:polysaccharide pyruvyl transferase WcaK-like protein